MELKDYRSKIDEIDGQLLELFRQRLDISSEMAEYKKERNLPVTDSEVERNKLSALTAAAGEKYSNYTYSLFQDIVDICNSAESRAMHPSSELKDRIDETIKGTPDLFPERAIVACQGVEGAYSQQACDKIFRIPSIMYFTSFDGVFSAVDNGLCEYGVLPLENSTAGSVNKIYDLMMQYNFSIVRSTRLKVDHNLLVKDGTKLSDVKEVLSHEQALNQCSEFFKKNKGIKPTVCANTAMAAQMVAESSRNDIACLSSRSCAELYGLKCIKESVQDQGNNYTRFICISKRPQIFPGSDKTSLMMTLPHRPGSLYKVLGRFYSLGINLIKLESRPLPDRDFEFMFYFDIETSIYSPRFSELMSDIESMCEDFRYLGSYMEVL